MIGSISWDQEWEVSCSKYDGHPTPFFQMSGTEVTPMKEAKQDPKYISKKAHVTLIRTNTLK